MRNHARPRVSATGSGTVRVAHARSLPVIAAFILDPHAVYDDGALYCALGLSAPSLARARREGRLRHTRQGNRVLYLGEWVLDWLRAEGKRQEVARAE